MAPVADLQSDIIRLNAAAEGILSNTFIPSFAQVFFADTLKFFLSLYGHKLPVLSLDISSDGALLASGSADKNLKVWGMDFGDCHRSLFAHQDSVMQVRARAQRGPYVARSWHQKKQVVRGVRDLHRKPFERGNSSVCIPKEPCAQSAPLHLSHIWPVLARGQCRGTQQESLHAGSSALSYIDLIIARCEDRKGGQDQNVPSRLAGGVRAQHALFVLCGQGQERQVLGPRQVRAAAYAGRPPRRGAARSLLVSALQASPQNGCSKGSFDTLAKLGPSKGSLVLTLAEQSCCMLQPRCC